MSRIVAALGIAALICAASMSCSVDASAAASGVDQNLERPGVIAVPVDYEGQMPGALILAESVRSFGGELSDVPIRLVIPSRLAPMIADQREKLASLRVGVSEVTVPDEAFNYVLGAKPFLAAQAERDAGDAAFVAILAPNTIVLRCPIAFDLPEGISLGYSTVHHQNIGSAASEPLDEFWGRLYEVLDVQNDDVFTNETLADKVTVRFYCNAGSFVVRPEERLLQAWATAFSKLVGDPVIGELCANGPRNVFLHQAALAGVVLKRLRPSQTLRLPDTYSYPLFFEKFHGGLLTFDSVEDVVTMRYEFRIEDLPVGWEDQVEGPPEVIAWGSKRLAD
ncbi:MAG: hypothetical protein P8Y93_09045 [Acidobacteriota bacterium]